MECVFCNKTIIKKETFYEDDNFAAIYNIKPVLKGHCLVVPKRHIEEMYDFNDAERKDFISFSNKAIFISLKYSDSSDFDFLMQKGENAGQSIKHLHFHILPRKRNDPLQLSKKEFLQAFHEKENSNEYLTDKELSSIVSELKEIAEKHKIQINEL